MGTALYLAPSDAEDAECPATEEDTRMKHVTLSSRAAKELNAIPWHDAANGVTLLTDSGHTLGVLVDPEDYQILRAVADITNDPRELFEMLDEEPHIKNEDDWMTLDEAFDDSNR